MIVRPAPEGWQLIAQQEHARLAAKLAQSWTSLADGIPAADGVWHDWPELLDRELLVRAIRQHDDGWLERDARPLCGPDTSTPDTSTPDTASLSPNQLMLKSAVRPLAFHEIPLQTASEIWRDSVRRVHGQTLQPAEWYTKSIDRRLYEWVWCALSHDRSEVRVPELAERFAAQVGWPVDQAELAKVVHAMLQSGSLIDDRLTGETFRFNPQHAPRAELMTRWVSAHFDWLARLAQEHRPDDVEVARLATLFRLDTQRQAEQTAAACAPYALSSELEAWNERCFRGVQFFDWCSLMLCQLTAGQARHSPIPGWQGLELQCRQSSETGAVIALTPWPFASPEMTFQLESRQIRRADASSTETLQTAYRACTPLPWPLTLIPA